MASAPEMALTGLFAQAYSDGFAIHGDIGLPPAAFESRLQMVIEKHLGPHPSAAEALAFLGTLHTSDLYLAAGCSQPADRAWRGFVATYQKYIRDIARSATSTRDAGREVAADVLSNLFLPGRSGKSRIASFHGQRSLATWLLLLLRFDEGLRNAEIARHLDVHPSGVTRQLQHICQKLEKKMISLLANKHRLGPAAIKECLADILENPEHSIIVLIRAAAARDADQFRAKCG